jgi:lipoic acid synthetase
LRNIREPEREREPKPGWLKTKIPAGKKYFLLKSNLEKRRLSTICQNARCPNINECWNQNHATFLIMGDSCTRNCSFCSVKHAKPAPLDNSEPGKIVEMARLMQLKYIVITSVTRDDLDDGGASHYVRTVQELKSHLPDLKIEVLIPDFKGKPDLLDRVLQARPDVLNHNLETVSRLYPSINRDPENYSRSLAVLNHAKERGSITKSGIMVGLGETMDEITELFDDLVNIGVNFLTIGQYLRPTRLNLPVTTYYSPKMFDRLKEIALNKGLDAVESGAFVRSSYHASSMYREHMAK